MQYLIHVGYPKAASTWLQSTLFAGLDPRIKPLRNNDQDIGEYQKSGALLFFSPDEQDRSPPTPGILHPFVFIPETVRQKIMNLTPTDCSVTCLSFEAWVGHPYSGGVQAREYADRIHACIPDAKIVIVIRRQEDMLLSVYADFLIRSHGTISLHNFLHPQYLTQTPQHSPLYYRYDYLVRYYMSLFGRDRVLVLPCELLRTSGQVEFVSPIYSLLGLEPPSGTFDVGARNITDYTSYAVLRSLPWLNLLGAQHPGNGYAGWKRPVARQPLLALFRRLLSSKRVDRQVHRDLDAMADFIRPYAVAANRNLQELTCFDLRGLGYTFE